MDNYFLRGFLIVWLTQCCTSKDLTTSIHSPVEVPHHGQTASQDSQPTSAETAPVVVAPPSLQEVQKAVQEASEQVEGRGAEEVLKELLERVVEAALGQVESEEKEGEGAVQEAAGEDTQRTEKGEAGPDTDEQGAEEGLETEGVIKVGEEDKVAAAEAFEGVAEEGEGINQEEGKTAAGSVEEAAVGAETGSREADGVGVISESPDTQVSEGVAEATLSALEETAVKAAGTEDSNKQDVLSKEAAETGTQDTVETQAAVEVETQKETVEVPDPSLPDSDVEQLAEKPGLFPLEGKTQVDELESAMTAFPSDNSEAETSQSIAGEQMQEVEDVPKDTKAPEVEDEQGPLAVEEAAAEDAEAEVAGVGVAVGGGGDGDGEGGQKEESEKAEEGAEEEQTDTETSHGGEADNREPLVISRVPEPEDVSEVTEHSPGNPAPTPGPSPGASEMEEHSNHVNEILTPDDDLSQHNPAVEQPTLDNVVKVVIAEVPQTEGEQHGEADELVEDTAAGTEIREMGLEAWKIGAIFAAVFLVLETVVIAIYFLKCRDRNSTAASQRGCEEGAVEPEATTGGDCSDDTLPVGNGDTQQIQTLDASDVVSSLAQNKEQPEENHVIPMSDLAAGAANETANTGRGPDPTADIRTSTL